MSMGPLFAGIAAAAAAVDALSGLIRRSKGRRRALLLELRGNLSLLHEFLKSDLDPKQTVKQLEMESFRSLWGSNFSFAALERRKVSKACAAGAASLERYVGWRTERVFETLYARIAHLKKLAAIGHDPARVDLRRRLQNLFLLLLLIVRHLEA
ncbi:MAG: hypothetical protein JW820_03695 [Spirochaetales bacterium]|nr:hypothetical protein [Spirochaetales bacterium]